MVGFRLMGVFRLHSGVWFMTLGGLLGLVYDPLGFGFWFRAHQFWGLVYGSSGLVSLMSFKFFLAISALLFFGISAFIFGVAPGVHLLFCPTSILSRLLVRIRTVRRPGSIFWGIRLLPLFLIDSRALMMFWRVPLCQILLICVSVTRTVFVAETCINFLISGTLL